MKRISSVLLALLLSPAAWSAETIKYIAIVDGGKQAGEQTVIHGDDGVTRVDFIFKDNGRGPELKEEYTLNPDGTFKTYQVTGEATFGAKIDERFSINGSNATWKSTSDAGTEPAAAGAQYAPLGGTPQNASVAIAALAARADGKLPLIPSGTMTMRKVDSAEVEKEGQKRKVDLVTLTGVGFTPDFAWVTTDAKPRLFASIYPGFLQLIEDGWQGNADALETRQKAAETKALTDLQQRLAHPAKGDLLIRNARVFNSEKATLGAASDVLVRDGRIVSIVATKQDARHTADHVIDAGGRVLLPGLFDSHAHVGRWGGGLNLAAGVTSVRDMGNDNETLQQIITDERAGKLLMPRIVAAGFLEGESKQSARNGFVVSDLAGAKKAIDWYAAHGYPQLKIYNSFPKDILKDTVAYAHGKGLRVSGHIPVFLRAQDAIDDGYDEIQHINQLMLNFLVKPDTDTRTLERFYLPAKGVADLDLDSKPVQDFIATLAGKSADGRNGGKPIVIDPTLATFEFLHQRNGELSPIFAGIADHIPPSVQRNRRTAEMDIPDAATGARYQKSFDKMVEFVGRAYKAGVPIVAGTDEVEGFTLQHELALYVRAGLTPAQALQIATWNGAKYAKVLDDRGSVAPGKRADLILIDGDPTANIDDIRKVATVIKGDTVYYPAEIQAELGIKPFTEPVRSQETE